ncbi:MAG: HupE/UreJ family protein [Pseudomonadota bacterium]
MRFILVLVLAAACLAGGFHLSQTDASIALGFYRPRASAVSLIALLTIGLLAARSGQRGWIAAAIGFAAVLISAALTPSGLNLPAQGLLVSGTLLALGVLAAWRGAPGVAASSLALALAGAAHGHALAEGLGGVANAPRVLGGFALGVGGAVLSGMALAWIADRLSEGLSSKLGAGAAGIGLYLLLGNLGLL